MSRTVLRCINVLFNFIITLPPHITCTHWRHTCKIVKGVFLIFIKLALNYRVTHNSAFPSTLYAISSTELSNSRHIVSNLLLIRPWEVTDQCLGLWYIGLGFRIYGLIYSDIGLILHSTHSLLFHLTGLQLHTFIIIIWYVLVYLYILRTI